MITIQEAEKQIQKILMQLETDTDSLVHSICVNDTDVTTLEDDRTQLNRCVQIELRRNPGSNW